MMHSTPAPAWLLPAYMRAATGVGATAAHGDVELAGGRLLDRWEDASRHFHNVRHLVDLLQRVDELQQETHDAHAVRLAAWYHGAVFTADAAAAYAHKGGEDEVASAEFARAELASIGVPDAAINDVTTMVEALARHSTNPESADCAVLCDADLAVLASDPQKYKQYLLDVRAEYSHIPPRRFVLARKAIVEKLLSRPKLYISPFAQPWEAPARQNLKAELARLERELDTLPPDDDETDASTA